MNEQRKSTDEADARRHLAAARRGRQNVKFWAQANVIDARTPSLLSAMGRVRAYGTDSDTTAVVVDSVIAPGWIAGIVGNVLGMVTQPTSRSSSTGFRRARVIRKPCVDTTLRDRDRAPRLPACTVGTRSCASCRTGLRTVTSSLRPSIGARRERGSIRPSLNTGCPTSPCRRRPPHRPSRLPPSADPSSLRLPCAVKRRGFTQRIRCCWTSPTACSRNGRRSDRAMTGTRIRRSTPAATARELQRNLHPHHQPRDVERGILGRFTCGFLCPRPRACTSLGGDDPRLRVCAMVTSASGRSRQVRHDRGDTFARRGRAAFSPPKTKRSSMPGCSQTPRNSNMKVSERS